MKQCIKTNGVLFFFCLISLIITAQEQSVQSNIKCLNYQTMKYFETHLSPDTFVRVHRSTIVNVTQISRVELFGKETYQLLLKTGVKLKVSLSGYRLLKERLGI